MTTITFPASLVQIRQDWTDFKKILDGTKKKLRLQAEENQAAYIVFALDTAVVYIAEIYKTGQEPSNWSPAQIAQNDADRTDYLTDWETVGNGQLSPNLDTRNRETVVLNPRIGDEFMSVTHDFCDKTTWYGDSGRITDEKATDSGDGLTWDLVNENIIDLTHGKVYAEDSLIEDRDVIVKADDVEMTPREPFSASGGDYEVDYSVGKIVFYSSQAGKTVLVTYSYATSSNYYLMPPAACVMDIEHGEAQFSSDFEMTTGVQFQVQGYVIVFAPDMAESNGGPLPDYTLIPLLTTKYKRIRNLIDEAVGVYPTIPIIGGSSRGTTVTTYGFPFRYGTVRSLNSAAGMRLVISTENDIEFGGDLCTTTFYGTTHSST